MDKQKQIEEMARTFGGCHITPNCKVCCAYSGSTDCPNKTRAQKLYEVGYRKITEDSVVLTEEEYERWQGQTLNIKKVRKEMAEKYHDEINKVIESVPNATKEFLEAWKAKNDEICKELTEGK